MIKAADRLMNLSKAYSVGDLESMTIMGWGEDMAVDGRGIPAATESSHLDP